MYHNPPVMPPVEPSHMPRGRADNDSFHGVSGPEATQQYQRWLLCRSPYPYPPSLSPSVVSTPLWPCGRVEWAHILLRNISNIYTLDGNLRYCSNIKKNNAKKGALREIIILEYFRDMWFSIAKRLLGYFADLHGKKEKTKRRTSKIDVKLL